MKNLIPILLEQRRGFVAQSGNVSTTVAIARPKWDDVYKNYPKNASGTNDMFGPDFYKMIFGNIYDLTTNIADFGKDKVYLYNGCAGKVSMALSLSGCPIVKINNVGYDFRATEGLMKGKTFISTASKMKRWLDAAWKTDGDFHVDNPTSVNDLKKLVGNRKGIYLMLAKNTSQFGASGHVTLWTDRASEKYVFGGHHYEESAKAMYFWELK